MSRRYKFQDASFKNRRGFTLFELLFVVGVVVLLSGLIFFRLTSYRANQLVLGASESVALLLRDARSRTLASRNSQAYSVRLESGQAVLYSGTYTAGAAGNVSVVLDSLVEIATISLAGGGSTVSFDRLSGKTSQPGTFVVRYKSDTTNSRTITVESTGIVSAQ